MPDAAFIFDVHRREWGRFFCLLTAAFLGAASVAADAWDLVVEVDRAGNVSVVSQSPVDAPAPPPQPLREGLTCLELSDDAGRLLDRRALPLSSEVFYDASSSGGGLEGGPVDVPKAVFHLRLPRPAARRQVLRFSHLRRRGESSAARRAAAPSASTISVDDFVLEFRGEAALESGR